MTDRRPFPFRPPSRRRRQAGGNDNPHPRPRALAPCAPRPLGESTVIAVDAKPDDAPVIDAAASPAEGKPSASPAPNAATSRLLADWRARFASIAARAPAKRPTLVACAAALALGGGWIGASMITSSQRTAVSTALAAQTHARLDRLADEVRQLRDSVAGIARGGRRAATI